MSIIIDLFFYTNFLRHALTINCKITRCSFGS